MKRIANFCLLVSFLVGYLEWGSDQHSFIATAEWEVISKATHDIGSMMHPFIILPFIGQVLLLITLFQKTPNRLLSLLAVGCLGSILLLLFVIGLLSLNMRILAGSLPFLIAAFFVIKLNWKKLKK